MKKKTIICIIVIVTILLIVLIGGKKAGWFGKSGNFKQIEVTNISLIDIVETVAATGKIQPEVEIKLSSEVSGEIIKLPIIEGQQVKKGDLLVSINPDLVQALVNQSQASLQNIKAQLTQAEANLNNLKLNFERNKSLYEKGVISKSDWERTYTDYEVAKANVKSAYYNVQSAESGVKQSRDNLASTSIFAPRVGTISKLSVELGERVVGTAQMAGTEIVRVAYLNNMEVEVDVNENDIVKVNVGDSTFVEVDADLKREFKGGVTEIANTAENTLSVDQVTNFKVKVRILPESYKDLSADKPENSSPFRPGMTATVDIITNKKENIIGIPISSIVIKTDTSSAKSKKIIKETISSKTEKFECVFVKIGDIAKLRVITTGIQDDSNIEITSGLNEGDDVITGPYNTVTKILKSGDQVESNAVDTNQESEEDK
jgi:HlyD family secretion protein